MLSLAGCGSDLLIGRWPGLPLSNFKTVGCFGGPRFPIGLLRLVGHASWLRSRLGRQKTGLNCPYAILTGNMRAYACAEPGGFA